MREILKEHFARYPKMQVADAVKLLYQSEFGGGHMIASPSKSLGWIKTEWEQVKFKEYAETPVLEEIGGGICRVSLRALDEGLAPETLNRMFVKTADRTVGTIEGFEKKLDILRDLCKESEAAMYGDGSSDGEELSVCNVPFSLEELENYLSEYKASGYPPVSHSEIYRENYHPAYRVVATSYARYYQVLLQIDRALAGIVDEEEECALPEAEGKKNGCRSAEGKRQVLVAIDGMCGSGKSTLGRTLEEIYDCNLFHMDDFFLRPEQRTPERFAEPGGNVDYERFKEEVLDHIADSAGFSYQVYNCGIQALDGIVNVPYKKLNIIEGAYSQHPYFGNPYDLKFVCKITPEEQVSRIMKRNGPTMLERFKNVWIPMENRYFETFEIEKDSIIV